MKENIFILFAIIVLIVINTFGCNCLSPPEVEPPTFSLEAGIYDIPQNVTISTITEGASIRYTTNGSEPTYTSGILYNGPVNITASLQLKAIACLEETTGDYRVYHQSFVTTAEYMIIDTVAPPSFNPATGIYNNSPDVTISTITEGASIRYTTDGIEPTFTSGILYTGRINVKMPSTIKAIAYIICNDDIKESIVESADFIISTFR